MLKDCKAMANIELSEKSKTELKVIETKLTINSDNETREEKQINYTQDGSVDFRGKPAVKGRTGGWLAGTLLLVNQGLATIAFYGVSINLVLFLTRVLQQNNSDAAKNVSKWTGTVYIFSLVGAFLSDSYWGRYKTCTVFQIIYVLGLIMLSLSSNLFLLKPKECGNKLKLCSAPSTFETTVFYLSIYMVALGYGGYQPNSATFGADQFDAGDTSEAKSKISFFTYFYLALDMSSLFSDTYLSYLEDSGNWSLGFYLSTASAVIGLVLFLVGTARYRHFRPSGNPLDRICQVVASTGRKRKVKMTLNSDDHYDFDEKETQIGSKKMLHTDDLNFLDRAAFIDLNVFNVQDSKSSHADSWRICTINQVEEVKCVLRLIPIWLCTFIYSVMYTQMDSIFVVQGATMKTNIMSFSIPPASMSVIDIFTVVITIFFCQKILYPMFCRLKNNPKGLTELERMGTGIIIAILAMVSAGIVEHFRLKQATVKCSDCTYASSSLHIMWQVPQYAFIGVSEVFMYVAQLEFFNGEAPDGLKSFGSALYMSSMAFGNFLSDLIMSIVMKITTRDGEVGGWIPDNLNNGHLDRFYFFLAALASINFAVYLVCAMKYKSIKIEGNHVEVYESSSLDTYN